MEKGSKGQRFKVQTDKIPMHCKRVKEIQGDHKVMKSAKGDYSKWKLNFVCEAKTMGASDFFFPNPN